MRCMIPVLVGALSLPMTAAGERLTDKQTKELIERINNERDRFEDQLDGNLKRSVLRGANGEVNVERYLDDLQENVGKLKDRYKPTYAAGAEALTVLKQGSDIQRYMEKQPPNFKGASEWSKMAGSLGELAAAYGTTFPLPEGATARRLNDPEVANAASSLAQSADRFGKELDLSLKKDKSIAPADRQAAVNDVKTLKKDAETLAKRLKDGQPATGEVTQVVQHLQSVRTKAASLPLSPAAKQALDAAQGPLDLIAQGFAVKP